MEKVFHITYQPLSDFSIGLFIKSIRPANPPSLLKQEGSDKGHPAIIADQCLPLYNKYDYLWFIDNPKNYMQNHEKTTCPRRRPCDGLVSPFVLRATTFRGRIEGRQQFRLRSQLPVRTRRLPRLPLLRYMVG